MIEFDGIDVLSERRLTDAEVIEALSQALSVPRGRVVLVDDVAAYPERVAADVVCVTSRLGGEFQEMLSIQTGRLELRYASVLELVQRLAALLSVRCMIPTDDPDPFVMWLVSPDGAPRRVALDPAAIDRDEYVVVGSGDATSK